MSGAASEHHTNSSENDDDIIEIEVDRNQKFYYFRDQLIEALVREETDQQALNRCRMQIIRMSKELRLRLYKLFDLLADFICEKFVLKLQNLYFDIENPSNDNGEPVFKKPLLDLFGIFIEELTALFDYEKEANQQNRNRALLKKMLPYLLPQLIICRRRFKEVSGNILQRISVMMRKEVAALIYENFRTIVQLWLMLRNTEPAKTFSLDVYLSHWIKDKEGAFYNFAISRSLCGAVLYLGINEVDALTFIRNLEDENERPRQQQPTLTQIVRSKSRILNILMEFRRLFDESFFLTQRLHICIKSLIKFMELLDRNFFNQMSSKFFGALKTSVKLGEDSIPCWETFLGKLDRHNLIALAPQIMTAIVPLLTFEKSIQILDRLYLKELILGSTKCNKLCQVLRVLTNNGLAILDNYLSEVFPPCELPEILKSCSALLFSEGVETYQLILKRILGVLNALRARSDRLGSTSDMAFLVRALLYSLQRTQQSDVQNAIGQCLGNIGFTDLTTLISNNSDKPMSKEASNCNKGSKNPNEAPAATVCEIQMENSSESDVASNLSIVLKPTKHTFVNNKSKFCGEFIESLVAQLAECYDSEAVDRLLYCIQENIKRFSRIPDFYEHMRPETIKEIEPLKNSEFANRNNDNKTKENNSFTCVMPIIENTKRLDDWIRHFFGLAVAHPVNNDDEINRAFLSLMDIHHETSIIFIKQMFPQVVLKNLLEKNEKFISQFQDEVTAVFRAVVISEKEWARAAAHQIFCTLDFLERFYFHTTARPRKRAQFNDTDPEDEAAKLVKKLFKRIVGDLSANTSSTIPLSVEAATRCNCYFRALRWLEQYGLPNKNRLTNVEVQNATNFDHESYYLLERIYSYLDESDGVLGAFHIIQNGSVPAFDEQVLMMMSIGNYAELLPMLCGNVTGQETLFIECLLKSNQPYLAHVALNNFLTKNKQDQNAFDDALIESLSIDARRKLIEYQYEVTCRLGDWDQLTTLQQEHNSLYLDDELNSSNTNTNNKKSTKTTSVVIPAFKSWGAKLAMLFGSLKQYNSSEFDFRVNAVRSSLMTELKAMTYEESEAFSQTNRYILKLRSLYEIEEFKKLLFTGTRDKGRKSHNLFSNWEKQSEISLNDVNVYEPIVALRRDILRNIPFPGISQALCCQLLQSSRLARKAGHLQTAWNFLVEAKSLKVTDHNIDIEEAEYLFEKGEQAQAIILLRRTLARNFSGMYQLFDNYCKRKQIGSREPFEQLEKRKSFVEAQLLLVELMQKAGASGMNDLHSVYQALEAYDERSETFFYRYAVFYDTFVDSVKDMSSEMVCKLLQLYRSVLEQGDQFLDHVMPRMLTVWMDFSQRCQINEMAGSCAQTRTNCNNKSTTSNSATTGKLFSTDPNAEMRKSFETLDPYFFFTSFAQMMSRITHGDKALYEVLKHILAELIALYPHQALWLSMAHARVNATRQSVRKKRCNEIFDLAKKKATQMGNSAEFSALQQQYLYLASALMRIASHKSEVMRVMNLAQHFPFLRDFFSKGKMTSENAAAEKRNSLTKKTSGPPRLILPFHEDVISTDGRRRGMSSSALLDESENVPPLVKAKNPTRPIEIVIDEDSNDSVVTALNTKVKGRRSTKVQLEKVGPAPQSKYRFNEVWIHGVHNRMEVFRSISLPKKLTFIGSDGRNYDVICKPDDQLCKDARVIDVGRMLNSLFGKDNETRQRRISIRCYSVIPLQEKGGIIECVPDMTTYGSALIPLMNAQQNPMNRVELEHCIASKRLPLEERVRLLRETVYPRYPLVMADWFRRNFIEACQWYNARLRFTRTAATMSIVGFVLGLGDRHCGNLLIDVQTGEAMHVDFNILFDRGELLQVPELVPFRLTRNMVDGFGCTGIEGTFRKSCEAVMRIMRSEKRMLSTVLQAFAHDPLVEWSAQEQRNQQAKQDGNKQNAPTTITTTDGRTVVQDGAQNDAIEMIKLRLEGNIVSAYLHRPEKNCAVPMSIEGQVDSLIKKASDEENLVQLFVGWNAFI